MNKYYSQCGQDKYLNEKLFKGKTNGVFLDIGANDGISYSNSYFFEKELGWKGICFEPLKSAFEKLQKNRLSININACASHEDRLDYFISISGYGEMLSGLKSKYDERHMQRVHDTIKEHGGSMEEVEVQCFDVNKLLEQHNLLNIDFLTLDTEGNELEILKAINYDKVHIKAITVENNYSSTAFNEFLSQKGFEKIKNLDADEVYVNKSDFNFFRRLFL
jgi:FkbM family methyltransferase